jgi:hypothetical protein
MERWRDGETLPFCRLFSISNSPVSSKALGIMRSSVRRNQAGRPSSLNYNVPSIRLMIQIMPFGCRACCPVFPGGEYIEFPVRYAVKMCFGCSSRSRKAVADEPSIATHESAEGAHSRRESDIAALGSKRARSATKKWQCKSTHGFER